MSDSTPAGLRVAVDARPLDLDFLRNQGIGRYSASLIEELIPVAAERRGELVLLRQPALREGSGDITQTARPHVMTRELRRPPFPIRLADLPEQVLLPLDLRRTRAQVHHAMSIYRTAVRPGIPTVMTLYDVIPLMWPDQYLRTGFMHRMLYRAMRRAQRLIAISKQARDDAIEHLGADPARIDVVYAAVSPHFRPQDPAGLLERLDIPEPYVLYVGGLTNDDPRKNVEQLIDAFAEWTRERARAESLVLAGRLGGGGQRLVERARRSGAKIRFTDFVPDEDLPGLYSGASCFVTASRYEGFGLPALEALACGTPVVAYEAGATPEVCGPGALLVAPDDAPALMGALERVLDDASLSQELRARGREQAARFSWREAAERTWRIYEEVAAE